VVSIFEKFIREMQLLGKIDTTSRGGAPLNTST
jgi:hypothetical protein